MRTLLSKEKERLDALACAKNRESAIAEDNLLQELPHILAFCKLYQDAYSRYLSAVLPQHPSGIQCQAGCGNCCHHFPMSVEPFELFRFYAEIRKSPQWFSYLEECLFRTKVYQSALRQNSEAEDPEDAALIRYFSKGIPCPFLLESGSCASYPVRPVTCRMYFSETPGKYCVPEHLQTDLNRSFIVYLPDDVETQIADISAHYRGLELPESLYGGLLAMNAYEPAFAQADAITDVLPESVP